MAKKGQKFKTTDEKIILQIIKEKKKGKSYGYLAKKYGVSDGSIATWVRKYNYKGYVTREKRGRRKSTKDMTIDELSIIPIPPFFI